LFITELLAYWDRQRAEGFGLNTVMPLRIGSTTSLSTAVIASVSHNTSNSMIPLELTCSINPMIKINQITFGSVIVLAGFKGCLN
jgi:hypothetical protein